MNSVHPLAYKLGLEDDAEPGLPNSTLADASGQPELQETATSQGAGSRGETLAPPNAIDFACDSKALHGMFLYAISQLFFSTMMVLAKLAGQQGIPTWEVIFVRSVVLLVCTLPEVIAERKPFGNRRLLLCFRGTTGFGAVAALFFALQLIPLADMTVITFLTPIFVDIASPFFLHEGIVRGSLLDCAICMVGVVLVAQPPFLFKSSRLSVRGALIALCQPVLSACAQASVRVLSATEAASTNVFYFSFISVLGSAIAMVAVPNQYKAVDLAYQWFLLIACGVCGFGTQYFLTWGLRNVKASQATTMVYLGIIFNGLFGIFLFKEYPDAWSATGDGIIIVSTAIFTMRALGVFGHRSKGASRPTEQSESVHAPILPK